MTAEWKELKRKLDETTDRMERAPDPEEKKLLARDVRELERLVEIAATADPKAPR